MPQLDFFSFTHQFLLLSFIFSGLYYFNLLILFPQAKWHELEKLYILRFLSLDTNLYYTFYTFSGLIATLYYEFVEEDLDEERDLLPNIAFIWNVSSVRTSKYPNFKYLAFLALLSYLILFLFIKNILVFNAEKLMFIYFTIVASTIIFLVKKIIVNMLKEDLTKLTSLLIEVEGKIGFFSNLMKDLAKKTEKIIIFRTRLIYLFFNMRLKQILIKNVKI